MVLFVIAAFLLMASHARADEPPGLNLGDLPAYRAALDGKPGGAAAPATFRELWDHPSTFLGKRVSIDGRVARRFRQGAIGTFPSLVEAWATSPAGDPFCLVYPAPKGDSPDAAPGASIQFEGVYLRQVTYRGSDA